MLIIVLALLTHVTISANVCGTVTQNSNKDCIIADSNIRHHFINTTIDKCYISYSKSMHESIEPCTRNPYFVGVNGSPCPEILEDYYYDSTDTHSLPFMAHTGIGDPYFIAYDGTNRKTDPTHPLFVYQHSHFYSKTKHSITDEDIDNLHFTSFNSEILRINRNTDTCNPFFVYSHSQSQLDSKTPNICTLIPIYSMTTTQSKHLQQYRLQSFRDPSHAYSPYPPIHTNQYNPACITPNHGWHSQRT